MSRLVVLCPLPEEAAGVLRRLRARARSDALPRAWSGRLAGRDALVCVTGDGPARSAEGAAAALALPAGAALVAGVAGALAEGFAPGALVVASALYEEAGGARTEAPACRAVAEAAAARAAPILTAVDVATGPEQRARLAAAWSPAPALVDLESWPMAAAARRAGVPWAVLRAVSDGAGESLPAYLRDGRRADGSVDRRAVAVAALARPWTVPTLARLRRNVARCAAALGEACERVAGSGWPDAARPAVEALDSRVRTP